MEIPCFSYKYPCLATTPTPHPKLIERSKPSLECGGVAHERKSSSSYEVRPNESTNCLDQTF